MSTQELIIEEIAQAPEDFSVEVLELIRALKQVKYHDANENALLSEHVLARDWLSPEEEEAWKNL